MTLEELMKLTESGTYYEAIDTKMPDGTIKRKIELRSLGPSDVVLWQREGDIALAVDESGQCWQTGWHEGAQYRTKIDNPFE